MATVSSRDRQVCPTCGDNYSSFRGVCTHHRIAHDETIKLALTCGWCGGAFEKQPGDVKGDGPHFCSTDCLSSHQSEQKKDSLQTKCDYCGAELSRPRSRVTQTERQFCDVDCRGEWMSENLSGKDHPRWRENVSVNCAYCGTAITRPKAQVERCENHFCSSECDANYRSENIIGENHHQYTERAESECEYCGEGFKYLPSKSPGHYCGYSCSSKDKTGEKAPNWRGGGSNEYGPGWNEKKKDMVRSRDNYECQACGMSNADHIGEYDCQLEVHHIIPARKFDNPKRRNAEGNLVTLCKDCHVRWEGVPLRPVQ